MKSAHKRQWRGGGGMHTRTLHVRMRNAVGADLGVVNNTPLDL
jgi:hypothetical protein